MAPILAAIIMNNTASYSSTGGNVVDQGGSVTQGDSYSSVSSENIVNSSGDSGGTATVHIETNDNGQLSQETITRSAPPGGVIDIEVATSSGAARIRASTIVGAGSSSLGKLEHAVHRLLETASTSASASVSISSSSIPFARVSFSARIGAFFQHLFGLFGLTW